MRQIRRLLCSLALVVAAKGQLVVSNITADGVSHSSLRLNWNTSGPVNGVRVRYGLTTQYEGSSGGGIMVPGTAGFTTPGQTASLSGLAPDTLYHFCPQSTGDGGATWSACVDFSAKTLPLPTVHPEPPVTPATVPFAYPNQSGGTTLVAQDCSNLQSILNAARYGDTILIPAGTICSGSYVLPPAPEAKRFDASAVNTATAVITLPSHGFTDGQEVHLDSIGCLPGSAGPDPFCQWRGVQRGTDYFVKVLSTDTFHLAPAASGPVLDFSTSTFTVNPATGQFTVPTGFALRNGTTIQVKSTGTLPGGLIPNTTYYVLNPTNGSTFQLSAAAGGAPISVSSGGIGVHSFVDSGSWSHFIMAWPPQNSWIVLRTATPDEQFCPEGTRCLGNTWSRKMATIAQMTPPTGGPADIRLQTGILTHNWRIVGIEFTHADNSAAIASTTDPIPYYGFIATNRSAANIILDRCYIHGRGFPNRIYRAIYSFDGENMALINSDLEKLDYWHPFATGLMPSITNPTQLQISPGTYAMGIVTPSVQGTPVTITLTGGKSSGAGVVYFDMSGTLNVVLPSGLTASCSGGNVSCVVSYATFPAYPNNSDGRIAAAQVATLIITGGTFTSFQYQAGYPQSASDTEGAQSFIAGNGPGPFLIQNNTISGTGLTIHFDDSGGQWFDRHDYIVRRNLFTAPLSQLAGGPQSDGNRYYNRSALEWKGGQRILVEGNIFEHNFGDVVPTGATLMITPRNGGYVTDVAIQHNTFRYNAGTIDMGAIDSYSPVSKPISRVKIANNLFQSNDGYAWTVSPGRTAGVGLTFGYAAEDLIYDHNTVYDNRGFDPVFLHQVQSGVEGVAYTNNIFFVSNDQQVSLGVDSEGYGPESPACGGLPKILMDCAFRSGAWTPSYLFTGNVLIPGWGNSRSGTGSADPNAISSAYGGLPVSIVPGPDVPTRLANIGFVSPLTGNFRLAPNSPYAGSGADVDTLEQAQGKLGTPSAVNISGSSADIEITVPDAGAACYVLYGTGSDVTSFARTSGDLTLSRNRLIHLGGLTAGMTYNFQVLCNGASEQATGSFLSTSTSATTTTTTTSPPPATVTIQPQVSITSPTNGSTVARKSTVTISTSAQPGTFPIGRVDILVSGTVVCSVATSPYSCKWVVPVGSLQSLLQGTNKSYPIQAKAYDSTGASGSSNIVTVSVK